jgi:HlyD family secretion protein
MSAPLDPNQTEDEDVRDDGAWREGRIGLTLIALFFGAFGLWAACAPLDEGVVAAGEVKVAGNRQVVQHRDGGVVSRIVAHEGDRVKQGDVLVELSAVELIARERALTGQWIELEASRERLLAESTGRRDLRRPLTFDELPEEHQATAADVLARQQAELLARQDSISAQISVLGQRQRQTSARIEGMNEQIAAIDAQSGLIQEELSGLRSLAREGFAAATRVRGAERAAAELNGRRAELMGAIEQSQEAIGEARMQTLSIREDRSRQIAEELRQTETQLTEVAPQLQATRIQLERTRVRAPATGVVVGMGTFNVGAVIAPGEKILELVPDRQDMIMEVRIRPMDADNVEPGQRTQVRLTAFEGRQIPHANGTIERISADRFEDQRTGLHYFTAEIKVPKDEMNRITEAAGRRELALSPGLPVEAVIPLRKRTALQYLLEPLEQTVWRSFREH